MADYGIKIARSGFSVTDVPSDSNKKNFVVLSTDSVHKVSTQGVVSADTNVSHGLGFAPMFDAYVLTNSLARAYPAKQGQSYDVSCDSTYLYLDETFGTNSLFYAIYLDQP